MALTVYSERRYRRNRDAIGLCVFIGRLCRLQASAGTAYPVAMTNPAALHSPGESKSLMEVLHQAE